jgi:excisionase family DNA binding protein
MTISTVPAFAIALDPATIDALAEAIVARLPERPSDSGWLCTSEAASYLGITAEALHKLTSARCLAFSQQSTGGRCYFRREDLDAYREQAMRGR